MCKTLEPYGVFMLCLYPFDLLELHEMHSLMQRSALFAEVTIDDEKVLICVHQEIYLLHISNVYNRCGYVLHIWRVETLMDLVSLFGRLS